MMRAGCALLAAFAVGLLLGGLIDANWPSTPEDT